METDMIPALDTDAQTRVTAWHKSLTGKISITLLTNRRTESSAFSALAGQLTGLAPNLEIKQEKKETGLPGFVLASNILFHAFPMEKELPVFLNGLLQISTPQTAPPNTPNNAPGRIDIPVRLRLYIALACPHCPGMVEKLIPLALQNPNIFLEIIDGSLFPDIAQKDNVMAAPCLIWDDNLRWTGDVHSDEIIEMITQKDPSQLSPATLQTVLEQGDAAWITRQMIEKQAIFDGFTALLLHDTWSVRLGAMVVVEELAQEDAGLAKTLTLPLISAFDNSDIPVQGDILYALGESGDRETLAWIRKQLFRFSHPDLKDAAEDAIDTLAGKHE